MEDFFWGVLFGSVCIGGLTLHLARREIQRIERTVRAVLARAAITQGDQY
jgi:hypothetical protein